MRILAIEDSEQKWRRIEAVVTSVLGVSADITWVQDLYEGERRIEEPGWDLLILDISLAIRAGTGRSGRVASDYTGGLKITARMFYLECEIPTVIVTGFDAFPTSASQGDNVILGVEDVERQARNHLKDFLLGTLRVGRKDWEADLVRLLNEVSSK